MSICPSRSPLTCPAQKVSGSEKPGQSNVWRKAYFQSSRTVKCTLHFAAPPSPPQRGPATSPGIEIPSPVPKAMGSPPDVPRSHTLRRTPRHSRSDRPPRPEIDRHCPLARAAPQRGASRGVFQLEKVLSTTSRLLGSFFQLLYHISEFFNRIF